MEWQKHCMENMIGTESGITVRTGAMTSESMQPQSHLDLAVWFISGLCYVKHIVQHAMMFMMLPQIDISIATPTDTLAFPHIPITSIDEMDLIR
jgi:hypothetical protein